MIACNCRIVLLLVQPERCVQNTEFTRVRENCLHFLLPGNCKCKTSIKHPVSSAHSYWVQDYFCIILISRCQMYSADKIVYVCFTFKRQIIIALETADFM